MIQLPITSYFAALLAFLFIALSVKVILLRRKHLIPIGDGGHPALHYAIRAHGNFTEYAIWYIVLCALCEMQQLFSASFLMLLSSFFILVRLSHARSLLVTEQKPGELNIIYRKIGMVGSFICILTLAIRLLL